MTQRIEQLDATHQLGDPPSTITGDTHGQEAKVQRKVRLFFSTGSAAGARGRGPAKVQTYRSQCLPRGGPRLIENSVDISCNVATCNTDVMPQIQ